MTMKGTMNAIGSMRGIEGMRMIGVAGAIGGMSTIMILTLILSLGMTLGFVAKAEILMIGS